MVLVAACGPVSSPGTSPGASCSGANQAQILVGEGFLSPLCGCVGPGETAGTVVSVGQVLSCHLSQADTQVVFYFGRTLGPHQIVSDGHPSLTPTPWVSGRSEVSRAFPVFLGQGAAIYGFRDVTSGIQGQIFVP